jgi:hypothetical protein
MCTFYFELGSKCTLEEIDMTETTITFVYDSATKTYQLDVPKETEKITNIPVGVNVYTVTVRAYTHPYY